MDGCGSRGGRRSRTQLHGARGTAGGPTPTPMPGCLHPIISCKLGKAKLSDYYTHSTRTVRGSVGTLNACKEEEVALLYEPLRASQRVLRHRHSARRRQQCNLRRLPPTASSREGMRPRRTRRCPAHPPRSPAARRTPGAEPAPKWIARSGQGRGFRSSQGVK